MLYFLLADGAPLAFVQFPPETLLYQQMQKIGRAHV